MPKTDPPFAVDQPKRPQSDMPPPEGCPRCAFAGDENIRLTSGLNVCANCGQLFALDEQLSDSSWRLCDGRGLCDDAFGSGNRGAGDVKLEAGMPTSMDFAGMSPAAMKSLLQEGARALHLREARGYDLGTLKLRTGKA